jgi:alpha-L-rhamnosidase
LEVLLANGWYKGRFGLDRDPYNDKFGLLAELHLTLEDGTTQVFCTDETWQWYESDLASGNGIYDGETLNRLSHADKENPLRPVVPVELGLRVVDRLSPPVREALSLPVAEVIHTPAGETVLDFGQNHTGLLRFRSSLPRGTEVRFEFGEILQQGNFYNENYRGALHGFVYCSDGREEIVSQVSTFSGFRYVRVTRWPGELNAADFDSPVLHTELDRIGWLTTGHEKLNRLYENTLWGQRSNFLSVPTDCPQRDERLGWTGDAQVFAPTACYNMDCRAFYRSFLRLLRLDQVRNDGTIATVYPRSQGFDACAIWSDACALIPETLQRFSGRVEEISTEASAEITRPSDEGIAQESEKEMGSELP